MASCDINGDEEKGGKIKKRRPDGSTKKAALSETEVPMVFKDVRAQRPIRSTSLCTYHYSPYPGFFDLKTLRRCASKWR
jgi:suppressor of cytokine signaling 7